MMEKAWREASFSEHIVESMSHMGYESPSLIGQGAFSKVYRVAETSTGGYVACKVSEHVDMLREEWNMLSGLCHPLIPKAYEWREEGGHGFLFMEYIPGKNLEQYILENGRLNTKQAVKLGKSLAEGLRFLHELDSPIIFRDLKPANIMVGLDGCVRLLDFGSGARLQDVRTSITGTQGYGAPEQWQQNGRIGSYTDVYALGKVIQFVWNNEKGYGWFASLLEDCTRIPMEERIPNMRCFLARVAHRGRKRMRKQGVLLYYKSILRL